MNHSLSWVCLSLRGGTFILMLLSLFVVVARAAPDEVLATAPGLTKQIVVTRSAVERYLTEFPTDSPEDAVQTLIDNRILAQIASKRGMSADVYVMERQREALAWVYLKSVFEAQHVESAVPEDEVRRVYRVNRTKFVHPEMIKADHIVIGVESGKSLKMPSDDKALKQRSRALLETLSGTFAATAPESPSAFLTAANAVKSEAEALGLTIRGESLGWFSLKDGAFDRNFAPEFRKACGMIGDTGLSEVFPSPFGWHIVRISDRAKAKNESFEQAKKLISKGVLNEIRKREVEQLTQRLAATYPPLSDRPGILGLIKVEPLIRLEEKRRLPKLDE